MLQKFSIQLFILTALFLSCTVPENQPPRFMMGDFEDDYRSDFTISDSLFFQKPGSRYHILKWNVDEQYLLAQNDADNPYDPLLYTRIDWMQFENMEPYTWGFCISAYKEVSLDSAETVQIADRSDPKTGCNGLPFSRMKPVED